MWESWGLCTAADTDRIFYKADTEGGYSGGPVCHVDEYVVAVHNWYYPKKDTGLPFDVNGGCVINKTRFGVIVDLINQNN